MVSSHLFYDQQFVCDIAHLMKGSLITSFLMTNREWVTLQILQKASHHVFSYYQQRVSDIAHFVKGSLITSSSYVWPIVCEWHCTFCERQAHYFFCYDQQQVSDIAYCVKCTHTVTSFPMTNSLLSDISYCMKGSLITSFPMTNSKWVTLHIVWKALSSYESVPMTNRL